MSGGTPPPEAASRLRDDGRLADQAIACLAAPVAQAPAAPRRRGDTAPARAVYSSDLTVDEAILLAETGARPRRLVIGCSIYHVGWAGTSTGYGEGELEGVTEAMRSARMLATRRLLADAQQAGGDVVVGVRLTIESYGRLAEFTAIGTAVARDGYPAGRAAAVATDLSGQDFYLLDRAGYEPCGLVFGNCVYYAPPNWTASYSMNNVELDAPTRAVTRARELAMARLQHEAEALQAIGVVGVTVSQRPHPFWRGAAIEFLAVGTAVRLKREAGRAAEPRSFEIRPVVELEDAVVATDPGSITGHPQEG
jgi:uncharacterized protein YbjQ (UPF0145 family)